VAPPFAGCHRGISTSIDVDRNDLLDLSNGLELMSTISAHVDPVAMTCLGKLLVNYS